MHAFVLILVLIDLVVSLLVFVSRGTGRPPARSTSDVVWGVIELLGLMAAVIYLAGGFS